MIMKKISITVLCLSLAAPLFADGTNQLADEKSRVSYCIGLSIAHNFKRQGLDLETIDPDLVGRAIKDVLTGGTELVTEAEAAETMKKFQTAFRTQLLAKNKAKGESFLSTNKLAPGIKLLSVSTPAGKSGELQYLVITNGTGPVPTATQVARRFRSYSPGTWVVLASFTGQSSPSTRLTASTRPHRGTWMRW